MFETLPRPAVLVVAACLVLAGCGGTADPTTQTQTTAEMTTSATTEAKTETPETTPPPGEAYTDSGTALRERGLVEDVPADSFTVTVNVQYANNGSPAGALRTVRQVEDGRALAVTEQNLFGASVETRYTADNRTYQRVEYPGSDSRDQYDVAMAPYDDADFGPVDRSLTPGEDSATAFIRSVEWTQRGTERFGETTVTRYEGTELRDSETFLGSENVTVGNLSVVVLVDVDGVMRSQQVTYDLLRPERNQVVTVDQTVTVTRLGSTTVTEPDWLANATDPNGTVD